MDVDDHEMGMDHDNEFIDEDDLYSVRVDSQLVNIDQVTPQLIHKMSKIEKETYIDKCRQLYMAMYEL